MMRRSPAPARAASALAALLMLALAGCGTLPQQSGTAPAPAAGAKTPARTEQKQPALPAAGSGRGAYYKDDGPGENPPPNLEEVPDAEVRVEAPLPRANRPYVVFGKTYTPISGQRPFSQRGIGSWYGKKFHGQRTSSGELYDMYKMTAAHPTLPIPSFVRLTSIVSGKQVIVRVNDRGPFHANRVIDVSYTAALKLGLLGKGSHELDIELLLPPEIERIRLAGRQATAAAPLAAEPAAAEVTTGAVDMPEVTQSLLPVSAPAATPAAAAAKNGFYLQMGAFARPENAEAARQRLAPYAGTLGTLEVVQAGTIHRLFGGPFASRQDAIQAAESLLGAFGVKPIVVQR
ncbi:septal ring lytic transglycosylase RlpA family protein [Janthinobacterium fluminis]|uniref:Endolytic peptidoglycan transglycosylase RlpA n=1 Tax=Janthinobacterium fluminis TaxID=2987524 RepID=A0ABT5K6J0_9BURK|nr:septal ring lytic transglycosylase RlpA family protein [Janthinobacterium fluminis]MDC8760614.1 septal ring lytic transglycosylase RlpA family protein [Janthinobacterium fluminis]